MRILWSMVYGRARGFMVPRISKNLFRNGMEDHHNVADLFHQVRTHGKWGCGNMLPIGTSMVPSEYLRCRWVLHGFGFNKFRLRWRSWWEVTGVLPDKGILVRFAHHSWTNEKISSPLVWWCLRFACVLPEKGISMRFARHWANGEISSPLTWWHLVFVMTA